MIKENEMDAIKKLIQKGFDLELISFELDIPLEEIKEFQQEIEKQETNTKKYNYAEITNKRNEEIDKKIQQLRERYEKLYLKN